MGVLFYLKARPFASILDDWEISDSFNLVKKWLGNFRMTRKWRKRTWLKRSFDEKRLCEHSKEPKILLGKSFVFSGIFLWKSCKYLLICLSSDQIFTWNYIWSKSIIDSKEIGSIFPMKPIAIAILKCKLKGVCFFAHSTYWYFLFWWGCHKIAEGCIEAKGWLWYVLKWILNSLCCLVITSGI